MDQDHSTSEVFVQHNFSEVAGTVRDYLRQRLGLLGLLHHSFVANSCPCEVCTTFKMLAKELELLP